MDELRDEIQSLVSAIQGASVSRGCLMLDAAIRAAVEAAHASRSAELAAIQMNGHEWMRAHDKLLAFIQKQPKWLKELIDNDPREKLPSPADLPDAIRAAVEAEREACCKLDVKPLPDSPPEDENDEYWNGFWDGRDALRQAIRRRTDNG